MILTDHYLHYFSFNISNIWCKIDSLVILIQSKLKVYFEYIWVLVITKVKDRLWVPNYNLFCETKWRISGSHGNLLFHFVLSFTTDLTSWRYRESKDFEQKCWVYYIVYITLWNLEGVSLLNNCLFWICRIGIGCV